MAVMNSPKKLQQDISHLWPENCNQFQTKLGQKPYPLTYRVVIHEVVALPELLLQKEFGSPFFAIFPNVLVDADNQ